MSIFNKGRIYIDNDMGGCWEIKNNIHNRNKFNPLYISMVHSQKTLTGMLKGTKSLYLPRGSGWVRKGLRGKLTRRSISGLAYQVQGSVFHNLPNV